jgi:CBS domain containing-hemolysin-like protein
MSSLEIALRLIGGVFLTSANAFFVVTEFALTRLPQLDPADDPPGLERARQITNQLEIYLTGCQLGITASSILLGVVAEPAFTYLFQPLFELLGLSEALTHAISVVVGIVLINLIHKIWGEQTPTYLGVERPRQVARRTAWALQAWTTVAYPFIMAGDGLAKGTLRLFGIEVERSWTDEDTPGEEESTGVSAVRREIGEVLSRADLSRERRSEILRAVDIEQIPVRAIMVPRSEIVALSTTDDLHENLEQMRAHSYSRYPLLDPDWDHVYGTLYTKTVFRHLPELEGGNTSLAGIAEPPVWVDPELPISDLIDRLQQKQQEIAIVRTEDHVRGLVTSTDAFEAIAGEMEDPGDVVRQQRAPSGNGTSASSWLPKA